MYLRHHMLYPYKSWRRTLTTLLIHIPPLTFPSQMRFSRQYRKRSLSGWKWLWKVEETMSQAAEVEDAWWLTATKYSYHPSWTAWTYLMPGYWLSETAQCLPWWDMTHSISPGYQHPRNLYKNGATHFCYLNSFLDQTQTIWNAQQDSYTKIRNKLRWGVDTIKFKTNTFALSDLCIQFSATKTGSRCEKADE